MATMEELVVKISADVAGLKAELDEARRKISGVADETENTGKRSNSSLKNLLPSWQALGAAAVTAGAAVAAGLGLAAKSYGEFEQTAVNAASVTGLTGQAYDDALANIKAVSRELDSNTVFSASEAANAMYDLASAGFDVSKMTTGELQPILDIAAATQSDLTFTTKTVTDAISQFGLTTADSGRVADVYAKAIGESKATMDSLSTAMVYAGPVSKGFGRSLEETTAAIARLNDAGFKGEQAGTAFRSAMLSLVDPSKEAVGALGLLGIEIQDINPTTHTYAEILSTLSEHGMTVADATKIFGKETAAAMTALVGQTFAVEDLTTSLESCSGAAEEMATKQMDTLSGAWEQLTGTVEGLVLSVGERLEPYLRSLMATLTNLGPSLEGVVDWVFNAVDAFAKWGNGGTFQGIKSQVEGIVKVFREWANNGGFDRINGFINQLKTNWKDGFSGALRAVKEFIDSGALQRIAQVLLNDVDAFMKFYQLLSDTGIFKVFGLVIEGVVRSLLWLIDTGSKINIWVTNLYNYFKNAYTQINTATLGFRSTVGGAWDSIRNTITSAGNAIYTAAIGIWNRVRDTITNVLNVIRNSVTSGWNGIRTAIVAAGAAILSSVVNAWNTIRNSINTAMNAVRTALQGGWNTIRTLVISAMAAIASSILAGWNTIRNNVANAINAIRSTVQTAWNAIRSTVSSAMSGISSVVSSGWNSIRSIISNAMNAVASAISSGFTRARSAVSSGISSISSSLSSAASSFYSAGSNWISSLISGLNSKLASLRSAYNTIMSYVKGSSSSSSSSSSSGSSGGTGTAKIKDDFAKFYSTPSRIEVHDTGGMAGYDGLHYMRKGEIAIPKQYNWDRAIITPVVNAMKSNGGVKGNTNTKMTITINNKAADINTTAKTLAKLAKIGATARYV